MPEATPDPTNIPAGDENLAENEISDLLSFDPFEELSEPTSEATPEAPGSGTPEFSPDGQGSETETQQAGQLATSLESKPAPDPENNATVNPQVRSEVDSLKSQLAQYQALLSQRSASEASQQPDPNAASQLPEYNFPVPPELVEALGSEDPALRTKGIQAMMTGTAMSVHQRMQGEFKQLLQQGLPALLQQRETAAQQRATIESDFYNTFQDLNLPQLRPHIKTLAEQVVQETGAQTWTAEIRDEVGRRAKKLFGHIGTSAASNPPPQMMGSSTRPAAPSTTSVESDINDTLFGGRN